MRGTSIIHTLFFPKTPSLKDELDASKLAFDPELVDEKPLNPTKTSLSELFDDSTSTRSARHEKLKRKALASKHWAKVREAKQFARESHAELIHAMGMVGRPTRVGQENELQNADAQGQGRKLPPKQQELQESMRRKARLASRESRCSFPKEWEM